MYSTRYDSPFCASFYGEIRSSQSRSDWNSRPLLRRWSLLPQKRSHTSAWCSDRRSLPLVPATSQALLISEVHGHKTDICSIPCTSDTELALYCQSATASFELNAGTSRRKWSQGRKAPLQRSRSGLSGTGEYGFVWQDHGLFWHCCHMQGDMGRLDDVVFSRAASLLFLSITEKTWNLPPF